MRSQRSSQLARVEIPYTQGFKINEPMKLNLLKDRVEALFGLSPAGSASSWERKRNRIVARLNDKIAKDAQESV